MQFLIGLGVGIVATIAGIVLIFYIELIRNPPW